MSKHESKNLFQKEELRGLFTLGLLAVIASIRLQSNQITLVIDGITHNVTHFLDVVLITWSLYAFFMVFALSKDLIGQKLSESFLNTATMYLHLSFIFIGLFGAIFFNEIFPNRSIWIFAYGGIFIVYFVIKYSYLYLKKISEVHKPSKDEFGKLITKIKNKGKELFPTVLMAIFVNSFLLILYGVYSELVFPSFVVGSICLVLFLVYRDLTKNNKKNDNQKELQDFEIQ